MGLLKSQDKYKEVKMFEYLGQIQQSVDSLCVCVRERERDEREREREYECKMMINAR